MVVDSCWLTSQDQVKRKKAEGDSGFIGTKTKNVPYQKINKMLRNYPQP